MSGIQIYDSLEGRLRPFEPLQAGRVGMYVCGPTVYSHVHLGNVRTFLSFDLIFRYLQYRDFKVRYVRNITDAGHLVDDADEGEDKVGKRAKLEQLEPMEIVQKYTVNFHEVMQAFNALPPSIEPTATGHIIEQIAMTQQLLANGWAYESNGSVYFDVETYHAKQPYGILSGRDIDEMRSGSRDLDGQTDKRSPLDFALWKKSKEGEPFWDSPWGTGRPGWHIECSAMAGEIFKEYPIDIHSGGCDLKFPHHDNEIAQSEAYYDCDNWINNFWHTGHLHIAGKKMSKSLKNFTTIK